MKRLTNTAAVFTLAAVLGLVIIVNQAQEASGQADAMTVDEVEETFIGKTSVGIYKKFGVKFAQYFSPNGLSIMKARHPQMGVKKFKGKHYFNSKGEFCSNYPSIPGPHKIFCAHIISLGDGRYKLSGNLGFVKEIVDGKQLNRLR